MSQSPSSQQPSRLRLHLHRSTQNRMIAGVCGGLAEVLGIDPLPVRIITLALLIPFNIFTVLAYVALALVLPAEG